MKILLGILLILLIITIAIIVTYKNMTSFVNEIDIEEPGNMENQDITQPTRSEVKMYVFAAGTIMKPAYKSIVRLCALNGNEKVMDFGSGAGPSSQLLLNELKKRTGQLTCLDISETWLKVVKQRFKGFDQVNYLLGDITTMDLAENTYDVILIHFVLHDIDEAFRPAVMDKLATILKPGGRLVIREPVSKNHGMPAEEIQDLMYMAGLVEGDFKLGKIMLFMPVVEGIYYKN